MGFAEDTGLTMESTIRMVEMGDKSWAADGNLIVKFYMGTRENTAKSIAAGHPVFDDIVKIRILKPGDRDYTDRPAWRQDFERFSKQYAAFKNGAEEATSGMPLSQWAVAKASQVEELKYHNIKTVEQLAAVPDTAIQKFMYGHSLRQAAKDFVEQAKSQAPLIAMRAELDSRDSKIATLQGQMAQLMSKLQGAQPGFPPGPGFAPTAPAVAPEGAVPYRGPSVPPAAPEYDAAAIAAALGVPEAVTPKKRGRPAKVKAEST